MADACLNELLQRMATLRYKIQLLLNLQESDHAKVVVLVSDLLKISMAQQRLIQQGAKPEDLSDGNERLGTLQADLVTAAQAVLKREWERVKQGE